MMASHPSCTTWRFKAQLTIVLLVVWWLSPLALAAETHPKAKPRWEMGLVGGGGWVPDYPAADEYHAVGLVLPYAIYRGDIFRAGDDGIARGRFFRNPRYEFDIGLGGSFPADSDRNDARRGMPDLDFLLQAGPRLRIRLASLTAKSGLSLQLPLRAVISLDPSKIGYRGMVFSPRLVYIHRDWFKTGTRFTARLGPIFATDPFMDYFYEVGPRFVTPNRPASSAKAGYLGSKLILSARLPLTHQVRVFGAVQLSYYGGATNADSPLFRDEVNVGVGFGMIWSILQSKKQAAD